MLGPNCLLAMQGDDKHLTSASVVGFWQLRSEICWVERTAWGNMLMPPVLEDDNSRRSSSSLASRSLIRLRFVPLDVSPPPAWEPKTAISSFTGLFPALRRPWSPSAVGSNYFITSTMQYFTFQCWLPQWSQCNIRIGRICCMLKFFLLKVQETILP
jgi:hypothetical protein